MEVQRRRRYSRDFKLDTINLIKLGDKSVVQVAKDLGVDPSTVYNWIRKYEEDPEESFPGEGKLKASDEELRKLRKQLADVTEERDILKKAISIFSQSRKKNTAL